MRPKILHITEPCISGVLTGISSLIENLPKYEHIILHGTQRVSPKLPNCFKKNSVFLWKNAVPELNIWKDFLAFLKVLTIILKTKPDIIHLHSSKAGFLGRCGVFLLGKSQKVIYTPHGISFLREDLTPKKKFFFQYLEQFAARYWGGKIIACSKAEQKIIEKAHISSICIPNGVKIPNLNNSKNLSKNLESESENLTQILDHKTVNPSEQKIWIVGTSGEIRHPQKGVNVFNQIAESCLDLPVKFLWIGTGKDQNMLKSPNIEITGWLNQEQVKEKLKNIDIYLSTSAWEGLSYAVLEAMSIQKPVLLSNCLGNLELLPQPEMGFENGDEATKKIKTWLKNPEILQEYGHLAQEKIRTEFSEESYIKSYAQEYEKIIQSVS